MSARNQKRGSAAKRRQSGFMQREHQRQKDEYDALEAERGEKVRNAIYGSKRAERSWREVRELIWEFWPSLKPRAV